MTNSDSAGLSLKVEVEGRKKKVEGIIGGRIPPLPGLRDNPADYFLQLFHNKPINPI